MKLEIRIKAEHDANGLFQARLAGLLPANLIRETTSCLTGERLEINLLLETELPDIFLKKLSSLALEIENCLPGRQNIDVAVKNIEGSEPTLIPDKNGRAFSPVNGIRIVPWQMAGRIKSAAHDIILDPADAFGNGLHPSTRLCLQLLKQVFDCDIEENQPARSVLDIGCGSGILTIAALRLGACCALGIEIDLHAVETARKNLEINKLSDSAGILEASWQNITGHYDLVLANLVPSVLLKAAPCMAKFLSQQGLLITAGFPAAKNTKIRRLFEQNGFRLRSESSLDGWGAFLLSPGRILD